MYRNTIERFLEKIQKKRTCWIWGGVILRDGYGQFTINGKRWLTHRLSYTHHIGPIPHGLMICHKCDNPSCVNPKHFFLGTGSQNSIDSVKKGRWNPPLGERQASAKLTTKKVIELRKSKKSGAYFMRKWNVSVATISDARSGKTWRHVK